MLPSTGILYPTIQKILESMKVGEKITTIVQPAYFIHIDTQIKAGFPEIDEDQLLLVDCELLSLQPVNDLYRDGTTFVQTLEVGNTGNTASPFNDCKVLIKLSVTVDDETIFDNFGDGEPLKYDLEEFEMPAVLRRVLKQTKLNEVVLIESKKLVKLVDHLTDKHQVFTHSKLKDFKDKVTIKVKLLEIEQKPHLFKVVINEKVDRLRFLAGVAQRYLEMEPVSNQVNQLKKAEKMFLRIQRYYRNKDAMNNFLEEDTQTLDYRNALDAIEAIHSANFCNFS